MKRHTPLLLCILFLGCRRHLPTPQEQANQATRELAGASNQEQEFYALGNAAKQNFEAGKIQDARNDAKELLNLAPKYRKDWNYGNAIHDANLVLGRIALSEGQTDEAKQHLIEAGKSPGSPQLNSFGPNMNLAKDLLEKGERDVVLQYFDLCRKFWESGHDQLDQWTTDVKAGNIPDFGPNLFY